MAISAEITLARGEINVGQSDTATLTVTNPDAADVQLTAIVPRATPNDETKESVAVSTGQVPLGGAFNNTVSAAGAASFDFLVTPHAPVSDYGLAGPEEFVYSVGALIYDTSGRCTEATPALLTALPPGVSGGF